jgi:hypothetical protein
VCICVFAFFCLAAALAEAHSAKAKEKHRYPQMNADGRTSLRGTSASTGLASTWSGVQFCFTMPRLPIAIIMQN